MAERHSVWHRVSTYITLAYCGARLHNAANPNVQERAHKGRRCHPSNRRCIQPSSDSDDTLRARDNDGGLLWPSSAPARSPTNTHGYTAPPQLWPSASSAWLHGHARNDRDASSGAASTVHTAAAQRLAACGAINSDIDDGEQARSYNAEFGARG